jgi:hypothetical protein
MIIRGMSAIGGRPEEIDHRVQKQPDHPKPPDQEPKTTASKIPMAKAENAHEAGVCICKLNVLKPTTQALAPHGWKEELRVNQPHGAGQFPHHEEDSKGCRKIARLFDALSSALCLKAILYTLLLFAFHHTPLPRSPIPYRRPLATTKDCLSPDRGV